MRLIMIVMVIVMAIVMVFTMRSVRFGNLSQFMETMLKKSSLCLEFSPLLDERIMGGLQALVLITISYHSQFLLTHKPCVFGNLLNNVIESSFDEIHLDSFGVIVMLRHDAKM